MRLIMKKLLVWSLAIAGTCFYGCADDNSAAFDSIAPEIGEEESSTEESSSSVVS